MPILMAAERWVYKYTREPQENEDEAFVYKQKRRIERKRERDREATTLVGPLALTSPVLFMIAFAFFGARRNREEEISNGRLRLV